MEHVDGVGDDDDRLEDEVGIPRCVVEVGMGTGPREDDIHQVQHELDSNEDGAEDDDVVLHHGSILHGRVLFVHRRPLRRLYWIASSLSSPGPRNCNWPSDATDQHLTLDANGAEEASLTNCTDGPCHASSGTLVLPYAEHVQSCPLPCPSQCRTIAR